MASGLRSIQGGSDQLFNNECNVCRSQDITSEGISYCTVCNEYLCQPCERSHKGSKATRDHRLLTGSDTSTPTLRKPVHPIMLCDTHQTSIIEFICNDHGEVICHQCKMANHTECFTANVSSQVNPIYVNATLRVVTNELADLSDRFNKLQTKREADKSAMKTQIQTCLKDLQVLRKDINDKLEKLVREMAAQILDLENEITNEIDGHNAILKKILFQIGELNKPLNEYQKSREDDITFVGLKKACLRKTEFEKIIDRIEDEIYPIDVRIEPNDFLTDMIDQLKTIGSLVNDKQTRHSRSARTLVPNKAGLDKQVSDRRSSPKSLLNIEVSVQTEEIDLGSRYAYGCVFIADGHLVVACSARLKLFDKDFRYKSELNIKSCDVAVINDSDVVVTQGKDKQLQRVRVLPHMNVVTTVKMDRKCYGVDVCRDKLYVTCHDNPGNGEVRVLTMDGNVLRRLGVDDGRYMFTLPHYVRVSMDGVKLFVSDSETDTITCLSTQGRTLYTYTDRDLSEPLGIYVDGDENLMVCGGQSHNVHVVRHDGKREQSLLSQKDGLQIPQSISYRPSDGCLAVVMGFKENAARVVSFKTTIK